MRTVRSATAIVLLLTLSGCWKVDPDLKLSTRELNFGASKFEATVTVTNDSKDNALTSGVTNLEYTFKSDRAWVSCSPPSGRLGEEESATHTISIDRSEMSIGENLATITVTSNGGDEKITVRATRVAGGCSDEPSAPSDPSPANDAVDVLLDAMLSWEGGSSQCDGLTATYDVYFGTASTPPFAHNNGSNKSWDPGTLTAGTLYYWRVVAKDANGSTSSETWSFRTMSVSTCSEGPEALSSLSPADGAGDVPLDQNLSWSGGDSQCPGLTATYDVYFGTSSPAPFRENNGSEKSWDPGTLENGGTYYWRVVAKDEKGTSSSGERSFSTSAGCAGGASAPCDPEPPDGKSNVNEKANLKWHCGVAECEGDDVTFIVYLGQTSSLGDEHRLGTTASHEYNIPTLEKDTTYYWKIVAQTDGASSASPVWRFTTRD